MTQKGQAIIGDLRTDALHEALAEAEISDQTLLALLALAGLNVSVQSGTNDLEIDRHRIARSITEGWVLTNDDAAVREAARKMLIATFSCRDNMSNSGGLARIAGDTIGASLRLSRDGQKGSEGPAPDRVGVAVLHGPLRSLHVLSSSSKA